MELLSTEDTAGVWPGRLAAKAYYQKERSSFVDQTTLPPRPFPSRCGLSCLHPPECILTSRPQRSRKHASSHLSASRHNGISLPVDFHSSSVVRFGRRQSLLPSLAGRLGRRQELGLLLARGSGIVVCGC